MNFKQLELAPDLHGLIFSELFDDLTKLIGQSQWQFKTEDIERFVSSLNILKWTNLFFPATAMGDLNVFVH